ncbi:MAG: conserved membrane protein of unknown function [Promethearchaeota archaeon]|nr:MAG: conserved membrane protein of unknown function [Candidatus Lokiarchaeota archaeon]
MNETLLEEFRNLYQNKWFKLAFYVNCGYLIVAVCLTLFLLRDFNDFLVYFQVGGQFLEDISNLYNPLNYKWAFRYFPLFGLVFVPFFVVGFDLGFIIAQTLGFFFNIIICIYLLRIFKLIRPDRIEEYYEDFIIFISIFLLSVPQFYNYILGQINLYISLLIIISLFLFLKYEDLKHNFLASILLGFTTILKPITLFIIPFIIMIKISLETKKIEFNGKTTLIRLLGVFIPLMVNALFFIFIPGLLEGFIEINLGGANPIDLNHSFSITKLITNFFNFFSIDFNQIIIILIIFTVIMGAGLIIYITRKKDKFALLYGYILGILIMLLVYFDSWDHHLLILTPLLIIAIVNISQDSNKSKKYLIPSFLFFSFTDLACVGLWYLLEPWFPFNFIPAIFLMITFIAISKDLLNINHKE